MKDLEDVLLTLEMTIEDLKNPTYEPLEVGFRHTPLRDKEIIERLYNACSFAVRDLEHVEKIIKQWKQKE